MAKFLINSEEAAALRNLVNSRVPHANLAYSRKRTAISNLFRFKTLETIGATTPNKANSAIWFFGDSTANLMDTDYVVDDSSALTGATSGTRGVCVVSSEYFALNLNSTVTTSSSAQSYMGLSSTAYASTDTTVVVDNLQPMDGTGTTLTTLSAYNKFGWNVLDNGECYIKYNNYTSRYELIQTRCT